MTSEEDTFNRLKRIPFLDMEKIAKDIWNGYVANIGVGKKLDAAFKENGWTAVEFRNEQLRRRVHRSYSN